MVNFYLFVNLLLSIKGLEILMKLFVVSLVLEKILNRFDMSKEINETIRKTNIHNKDGLYPMVKKLNTDYYNVIIPDGLSFEQVKKLEPILSTKLKKNVEIQNVNFKYSLTFSKEKVFEEIYPMELIKHNNKDLIFPIGYDIDHNLIWVNMSKNPNLLLSGLVNSGKSVCIHNIILQTLHNYNITFTLIDMKAGIELFSYANLQCVNDFVYEPKNVVPALLKVEKEINNRLIKIRDKGYKNTIEYNKHCKDKINYHLVIFEELMALGKQKEVMEILKRCLSISRATGIYFILTSQRFDITVLDGSIKANHDNRITFKVASEVDSRVILDQKGAELLTEKGRALCYNSGVITEVQTMYVDTEKLDNYLSEFPKKEIKKETKPIESNENKNNLVNEGRFY